MSTGLMDSPPLPSETEAPSVQPEPGATDTAMPTPSEPEVVLTDSPRHSETADSTGTPETDKGHIAEATGQDDNGEHKEDNAANEDSPTDDFAMEWRTVILGLPPRDLLRLVQEDKFRTQRIFVGFRTAPELIRQKPLILNRLVAEAESMPRFAQSILEMAQKQAEREKGRAVKSTMGEKTDHPDYNVQGEQSETGETPTSLTTIAKHKRTVKDKDGEGEDSRTREKLAQQRAALLAQERQIKEWEATAARLERERDAARTEAGTAKVAQQSSLEQIERLRRQQERATRRAEREIEAATALPQAAPTKGVATTPSFAAPVALVGPFADGLRRLLSRGKQEMVAEVCREVMAVLQGRDGGQADAAPIRALYAEALYATGNVEVAVQQDREAAQAFLDNGRAGLAAESLFRALAQVGEQGSAKVVGNGNGTAGSTSGSPGNTSKADLMLLRRVVALAERTGESVVVQTAFARMGLTAPQAHRALCLSLAQGGERFASLLNEAKRRDSRLLGADVPVALPTAHDRASTATARDITHAVEVGDERYVSAVRVALNTLRANDNTLVDALLAAVAVVLPAAVIPLTATAPPRTIVVDASNVARHNPDPLANADVPHVVNLLRMRDYLMRRGFFPVLMIADASLRFAVDDRSRYLELVERGIVRETLPGTSADGIIIQVARDRDAPIVTNDRLAEWGDVAQGLDQYRFGFFGDNGVSLTSF